MAVLVTGGAGYIGSHMVLALLERGEKVVVIDDLSTGFSWAVSYGAEFYIADFGDFETVSSLINKHHIQEIIHFAAKIVVPDSVIDPLSYYNNNTVKARALLAAAVRNNVQNFIFSSTAAVYGDPVNELVGEEDGLKPLSPYGRSKLMVEWMLDDISHAHPLTYAILRYFNVAGADPLGRSGQSSKIATHLIKVAVQAAIGVRDHVKLFGYDYPTPDGTCVRDYVHVVDLVTAHVKALTYLRDHNKNLICNCGYGRGFSVKEVLTAVRDVSGVNFPIENAPRRSGDPAKIVASNHMIKRLLGWEAQFDDLHKIIEHALAWEENLLTKNNTRLING
jgi:UDP-glucose 4-epimerase